MINNKFYTAKFSLSCIVSAIAFLAFTAPALADDNLLTNPGFETGNFSGWNAVGPFRGINGGHLSNFSAYCGAGFGDNGTTGDLFSQTIPTTPGLNYDVSLWVIGTSGGNGDNYIIWDGTRVLDQPNQDYSDWTQITVRVPATATSTTVSYGFYSGNAYLFDDASVALATPEPSTLALGGLATAALALWRRKK
jgi:hypothetical protein